jgi:hypothetical protein
MDVVLIHLGGRTPRYFRVAAEQVRFITGREPVSVRARRAGRYAGERLARFRESERLSPLGQKGLWRYACERFFVLEELMQAQRIDRCLHIESDNLLYVAPTEFEDWLIGTYAGHVATCPLTDDQDTAAVLYVGSLAALAAFNDQLLQLVALGPERLLADYGGEMGNEMRMLFLLRTQFGLSRALPTTIPTAADVGSPVVFDAASYGQWVDGTPWSPGVPYAGDHQIVGRAVLAGEVELLWDAQRRAPYLRSRQDAGALHPLANLHVHSKRLACWRTPVPPPRFKPPVAPGPLAPLRRLRRKALRSRPS